MGRRSREHREAMRSGTGVPLRQKVVNRPLMRCMKCKQTMSEENVDDHLKKCQPDGAKCGKCGQIIKENFLHHFKTCQGEKKKEPLKIAEPEIPSYRQTKKAILLKAQQSVTQARIGARVDK